MKKFCFIINPHSGISQKGHLVKLINELADPLEYQPTIAYTEYVGHASEIVAQALSNHVNAVIAVGGDGTVNEIATALCETNVPLGIIPRGSGNGFARHLDIPFSPREAITVISKGYTRHVDYGTINGKHFFCTCGIGFDALISYRFSIGSKRGIKGYFEQVLRASRNYISEKYHLEIDGKAYDCKAFIIAIGNASQYGNNAYITPEAKIADGLLNMTIVHPFAIIDTPELAFQLFSKDIHKNKNVATFKCKHIKIDREAPGLAHYDGESCIMDHQLTIDIHSQGLAVICQQKKKQRLPSPLLWSDLIKKINKQIPWPKKG
ncbi:MAG: diacylglycerol kinase family protein [Bacteroidaceae bacterium]